MEKSEYREGTEKDGNGEKELVVRKRAPPDERSRTCPEEPG
jgi:hypothetical protein